MSNKTLKGSIHFSKRQVNYPNEDYISIELRDEESGVLFLDIDLDLKSAAQAILFSGFVDVDMNLRGLHLLGMKRQVKSVTLELDRDQLWEYRHQIAAAHELDGWKASEHDLNKWNHHHSDGKGGYRVGYTRWVDKEND